MHVSCFVDMILGLPLGAGKESLGQQVWERKGEGVVQDGCLM